MKGTFGSPFAWIAVALVALVSVPTVSTATRRASDDEARIIVGYDRSRAGGRKIALPPGVQVVHDLGDTEVVAVDASSVEAMLALLRRRPDVAYAELDGRVRLAATPNDPRYGEQWALPKIDGPRAWDTTTGSRDVVVGVVDDGVWAEHPDLEANMWENPGGVAGCPAGTNGYNAKAGSCALANRGPHGTFVAGVVGAAGNSDRGIAGVAWSVGLMDLQFMDADDEPGQGRTSDAVAAIRWAIRAREQGVNLRVLLTAFTTPRFSQGLLDAVRDAGRAGVLVVAPAGDTGSDNDADPVYPCNLDATNVICVTASDPNDRLSRSGRPNWGDEAAVDLAAPGEVVLTTLDEDDPNFQYQAMSGTSIAAAHVAGAAVLVAADSRPGVTDLKWKILNGVDPIEDLRYAVTTGGRLNVANALTAPSDPPPTTRSTAPTTTSRPGPPENPAGATAGSNDDGAGGNTDDRQQPTPTTAVTTGDPSNPEQQEAASESRTATAPASPRSDLRLDRAPGRQPFRSQPVGADVAVLAGVLLLTLGLTTAVLLRRRARHRLHQELASGPSD